MATAAEERAIDEIDINAPGGWHCRVQAEQEAIQAGGDVRPEQPQDQEEAAR